jgi:hypothetical protein
MSTTLTIGGSLVTLSQYNAFPVSLSVRLKGISTLTINRVGGALPGLPDPWLGKAVVLAISGTTRFTGDVTDADPSYTNLGWVTAYQCRCLRFRGDRIPFTDSNTTSDSAAYNLLTDDPLWLSNRSGRTVGQILTDALTGTTNATALDGKGIGGYTSLSPPTLPSATTTDLSALTLIPPAPVYVQGERLLSAIEAFLSAWAPNHAMYVQPNGTIRFLDMKAFTNNTLTMGTDPIEPTPLRRSVSECYQKVIIRGASRTEPKLISLSSGILAEDFSYGALSNAAAKAAWTLADYEKDAASRSEGTCTCTDTLNVVVDPTDNTQAWAANDWDQTTRLGVLYLYYSAGSGINQFVARRISSNASLAAAGTSNMVVSEALPATNYNRFQLYGVSTGAGFVWRKYQITDAAIYAAMARQFTWPVPLVGANGDVATMTSFPVGSVLWSSTGNPPYQEWPAPFTFNTATGDVIFQQPTYKTAGNKAPSDVRILAAVNVGSLTATKPASSYEGTSYTVEGMTETLTVTVPSWRDPANQTAMNAFAQDMLDSVKDSIMEGSAVYRGLYTTGLTMGNAVRITGNGYTTGWESYYLPIHETEVRWNSGQPSSYTTTMQLSNRRAHFSSSAFLRPERPIGGALISGEMDPMRGPAEFAESVASTAVMRSGEVGSVSQPVQVPPPPPTPDLGSIMGNVADTAQTAFGGLLE